MEWEALLSGHRLGRGEATQTMRTSRTLFQQDYDRIVFSSAFRRLQDKTQVFPLAENDHVRTRLTHSLEVACVARSLGTMAGEVLVERYRLESLAPHDLGAIAAAAALAHDIGNPPFGHAGEDAIRFWFRESPWARRFREQFSDTQATEFSHFEGNAQGFRILTRGRSFGGPGGMQLTAAVLGAFGKYPRCADPALWGDSASQKKHGFFEADGAEFAEVAATTGLIPRVPGRAWCRHPLAFLVEAADDICYLVVDFEDGFRQGCLDFDEVVAGLLPLCQNPADVTRRMARLSSPPEQVALLRARAIDSLIQAVIEAFLALEPEMRIGVFDQELLAGIPAGSALAEVRQIALTRIYTAPVAMQIESAGYEVVYGLLDGFAAAVWTVLETGHPAPRYRSLWQLLPTDCRLISDAYRGLLGVTDYVSGMTDSFAVSLYRRLKGISLPGLKF
ncbi:Deoxyguanosinetriphosphate triphosphohydrolase-like protein [Gammaproteobacteria bacterium]